MKIHSTCQLCRMGILTKTPLCLGCKCTLTCAFLPLFGTTPNFSPENFV